jgi:peptidoglycan/LPS O-acetylase OafA/YrhL
MKVYFPGLNGLRAIAATIVICFHVNSTMWFFGSTPIDYFERRDEMSRHAVVLFFVLSGYLITFLLLKEKERFGTIDIKKFYLRRILRIWPLFYAALVLALLIVPFNTFGHTVSYNIETVGYYALFVPNFAMMAGFMLPTIVPLWSVGVEEQFYAIWPVCMNLFKNTFLFLAGFLFLYIVLKLIFLLTGNVWTKFSINLNYFSYDTMAIGGIAAWCYATNQRILRLLYHPFLQAISWLFFIASCIFGPFDIHYIINKEIYSIAFAIIILNVSTNPKTMIGLKSKIFDFLGKISYGMYVLHPFVIVLLAVPLKHVIPSISAKPLQIAVIALFVIPITILFAWLSFRYFELTFLKRKENFSRVPSTNDKRELQPADEKIIEAQAMSM